MSDTAVVFREMARVMRATAKLVIFTATPTQARACWLAAYFPDMIPRDAACLPSLAAIDAAAKAAGLTRHAHAAFHITETTQDRFFYSGKHRPEIYLDAQVRANMSPFRLIEHAELTAGLAALKADIDSGGGRKSPPQVMATAIIACWAIQKAARRLSRHSPISGTKMRARE